jgi:hypothetical protein
MLKTKLAASNPVVFPSDAVSSAGWYFRAAGAEAPEGPFPSRKKAIDHALKAMAGDPEPAVMSVAPLGKRRAA